jgi:ureidoacrylate peracid hydrolase
MHDSRLPDDVIERAIMRRGRLHAFEALATDRTALVVIDMQNMFLEPGAPREVPVARDIVPNVNRLARAMRRGGGTVVWVKMTQTEAELENWSVFYQCISSEERGRQSQEWLKPGCHGHDLWPHLDVADADLVVTKNRYSAFLPGASVLPKTLGDRDIDTVVIAGTLSNVCCESSARDAMMSNFKTLMISDANAALSDFEHIAALTNVFQVFGDVQTTDEVIALLESGAG